MAESDSQSGGELGGAMIAAAETLLSDEWGAVRDYLVPRLKDVGDQCAAIEYAVTAGTISHEQAQDMFADQVANLTTVFIGVAALSEVKGEAALNAVLAAVEDAINRKLGFHLLS